MQTLWAADQLELHWVTSRTPGAHVGGSAMPRVYPIRTVLAQRVREHRLTCEEFSERLEVFARENNEVGTMSTRHVQRLTAGLLTPGQLRPATTRLLEKFFGSPIEELLAARRPIAGNGCRGGVAIESGRS
jgi:hypothetical protein